MEICNISLCTGCGMCQNICPKGAIVMGKDKHGFSVPTVDEDLCVNCGLCSSRCPANNKFEKKSKLNVFAGWAKDKKLRKASTSGGVFSLIAENILNENGVVAGCAWGEAFSAEHIMVERAEDLYRLRGSKYVQSNMSDIYIKIKKVLDEGRPVLFSGTPCQVHALKSFLGKDYENLWTVDLVCHGVPSYDMFKKHLDEITGGDISDIKNVYLRYKNPCWSFGSVRVEKENGTEYQKLTVEDAYFNLFNMNYSLRNSCHNCRYTNLDRTGDITLCDFWGFAPNSFKMMNYDKGVSAIIINSDKGEALFDAVKEKVTLVPESIEKVIKGNKCLKVPFKAPDDCESFWEDYSSGMSISDLNIKYIKNPYRLPKLLWLVRLKRQYKWIIKKVIK